MAKKKKSRADGEGSIFQRKADGRWVAQVQFVAADGKRRIKTRVTATQGDARRALTTMKGDQDAHRLVVSGKATVKDWLSTWLDEFIKPNRAPRTYRCYYDVIENHLPARVGNLPLGRVASEDVQRGLNLVAEKHPRTGDLLRAVLRSAFNKALKLRRMSTNPVLGTDPVRYTERESQTFTVEEAKRVLDAAEGDRLGALFIIALSLGLRKGEATGLKPADVNLEGHLIHVRRSLSRVKMPGDEEGHWDEREPKRGSVRDLPMTETIYRALVRHIAKRQEEAAGTKGWVDSGFLFVSVTGARLHQRNVSDAFEKLCTRAKVPRIRFHDVRHSCGTLLHVQGADPFVIQKVLGHSQLSTTRRYTHVPASVTKAALAGMETMINAAGKNPEEKAEPAPPEKLIQVQ